jgi:hypothetical protein
MIKKKRDNTGGKKFWHDSPTYKNNKKIVFAVYVILRALVAVSLVLALIDRNYENAFVCILVLILYMLPDLIESKLRIRLPATLEIVILLFIFAAEILGELQAYFVRFQCWDTMLHTVNGFLCAAVGFSLVDLLNRNERFSMKLSPGYLAIVAFCFSMTVGVLWEFFECAMDLFTGSDMQKDTVIHAFSSVMLDPTNSNIAIRVRDITDVAVNGESLGLGGYLDIGLYDTMEDLFVNFIGAVVFSTIGYFYVKRQGKGKIASRFIPQVMDEEENKSTDKDSEENNED